MKPPNPFAKQWEQFRASTTEHVFTVRHDDGLYRHLHMGITGTGLWSWNVVTWPWHLYVGGDIGGGFVWSREEDMVSFMDTSGYGDYYGDGSPLIQADYWAEKLDHACHDRAYGYSRDEFVRHVEDAIADSDGERPELVAEAHDIAEYEFEAREWLRDHDQEFPDSWEWNLKALDHHYLLACYAVATTIQAYQSLRRDDRIEVLR